MTAIPRPWLLAGAIALAAAGATCSVQAAEKITWNLSTWGPQRAYTAGIEAMAEQVEKASGGNFTIRIHYSEAISPAKENLDGLKIGAFEMATICTAYHPGKNPAMTTLDLPFLPLPTLKIQQDVSEELYKEEAIKKEMARWNAAVTFRSLLPQSEFMGNGPAPLKLEDWKGMRVRALGGTGQAMTKLGAVPTTVPAPEVYTGIERGMFQAAAFPFSYSHGAYKIHEVSKWYTFNMAPGSNHCPTLHSITAFEALPAEYKEMLMATKEPAYEALIAGYKAADDKWIPIFDKAGLTRITYDDAQLAELQEKGAKPVWQDWAKEMDGKGVPGQHLLDVVLKAAKQASGS
ncbi:TRAP-type mannitol/chloroaromatic compound transport system substrate-binding protein [Constrictibacter sp. MBR-5]|jgi:TRAP-type mannitol/chloroaromatic compound transport system substrate-binding protein|uniref:TRAP transporter substrate-binding protein DctP n=1 Tax=Constrictibacter sp. MBR-5 TaxID=3156467 RepID=UPI00339817B2